MRYAVSTFLFFLVLAGCGKKRVEDAIALLANPDRQVRQDATYDLILLGGRTVEPLLARAATGSDNLRFISAQILGKIGDTRAIPLLRQFASSPNVHVSQEAVRALGQMGDTTLVEPLVQILQNDARDPVRRAAAESLGNLRGAAAVAPLVRALADTAAPVRQGALAALHYLRNPAVEKAALKSLQDPDETVRYIAAQMLGTHRIHQGLTGLRAALRDNNVWVRAEAARALELLGDSSAVDDLIGLLKTREGPDHTAARKALKTLTGSDYVVVE